MSDSINENYISIEDAAWFLDIKTVTLRKWIKDDGYIGGMPHRLPTNH